MTKCNWCGGANENAYGDCKWCEKPLNAVTAAAKPAAAAPKDESETIGPAAQAVLAAADFMNADALLNTGKAFLNGVGYEKNRAVSYQLFYKGAQKGDPEAMFHLAQQLEKGLGTTTDLERAVWWYIQAARAGSKAARAVLAENLKSELPVEAEEKACGAGGKLKDAVLKVRPFCVEITACSGSKYDSSGSGCIISPTHVLTNHHVIVNKRTGKPHTEISLRFHESVGDTRCLPLEVAAYDAREDIAICVFADGGRVEADGFPRFVDARSLELGDEVFTIGNALGRGLALSAGVIAKEVEYNSYGKSEVIRTDMSVNGGNSGGGLFDLNGNIAGLITFVPLDQNDNCKASGMSYAVTSNTIAKFFRK